MNEYFTNRVEIDLVGFTAIFLLVFFFLKSALMIWRTIAISEQIGTKPEPKTRDKMNAIFQNNVYTRQIYIVQYFIIIIII